LQLPERQYGVAPEHATPQPPQLLASVAVSTHAPPQSVVPSLHPHVVPRHGTFVGHTFPQRPQLLRSICTHAPPQSMRPGGHVQTPLKHVWSARQVIPHPPQLLRSERGSAQIPPQLICAAMKQPVTHVPESVHSGAMGGQRRPHIPQLFLSWMGVSQPLAALPSQLSSPGSHTSTPVSATPVSVTTPLSIATAESVLDPVSVTLESMAIEPSSPPDASGSDIASIPTAPSLGGLDRSGAASSAGEGGEHAPSATSATVTRQRAR
jgi:hypothetical protein